MKSDPTLPNQMKQGYPRRVWLLTITAPTIFASIVALAGGGLEWSFPIGIIVFLVGGLLSVPAFIANMLLCRWVAEGNKRIAIAKAWIVAAQFGFTTFTFGVGGLVAEVREWNLLWMCSATYGTVASVGAIVFQLRIPKYKPDLER